MGKDVSPLTVIMINTVKNNILNVGYVSESHTHTRTDSLSHTYTLKRETQSIYTAMSMHYRRMLDGVRLLNGLKPSDMLETYIRSYSTT